MLSKAKTFVVAGLLVLTATLMSGCGGCDWLHTDEYNEQWERARDREATRLVVEEETLYETSLEKAEPLATAIDAKVDAELAAEVEEIKRRDAEAMKRYWELEDERNRKLQEASSAEPTDEESDYYGSDEWKEDPTCPCPCSE